ncbi:MAG: bifunctional folylpolyglutamate synthase/dihydrofolate synthase [Magnetococcus sp. DMHC-6]
MLPSVFGIDSDIFFLIIMKNRVDFLLSRMEQLSKETIFLGLDRIERLLVGLGSPQAHLKIIHVAGTNGKGSCIAFLEAIFLAQGYRVASYVSPHLQYFNERIRLQGRGISDAQLVAYLERVLRVNSEQCATFFELTTAAALACFADWQPDWVLLETGLGGRLDATNAVSPKLCLINNIDLDHQELLGTTLAQIAMEKGGILKSGVPAAADPGSREAEGVLMAQAQRLKVPLWLKGQEYDYIIQSDGLWRYRDALGELTLKAPSLAGTHQFGNAALAVAGIRLLQRQGVLLSELAIQTGLTNTFWPGRLHCFLGPPCLLLDGAHNPAAARRLAQFLREMILTNGVRPEEIFLIFSAFRDKDIVGMIHHLAPVVGSVWVVPLPQPRGSPTFELARLWEAMGRPVVVCSHVEQALHQTRARCPKMGCIVVTGSLHLVGDVYSLLHKEKID